MKKSDEFDKFFKKVVINIKKARMSKGLTQEDMLKFGFNYRHYQKLESGKHSPNLETLFRLAQALECSVFYFLK